MIIRCLFNAPVPWILLYVCQSLLSFIHSLKVTSQEVTNIECLLHWLPFHSETQRSDHTKQTSAHPEIPEI